MRYASQFSEIDIIVACSCLLAATALLLLWRRRHLRAVVSILEARLAHERGARDMAERALADTRKQVHHLSASQQSLRDADRRRIARDLHDDLGQHLLALGFDIDALSANHPPLAEPLARMETRLQQISGAMRSIVRDLRPEALESGLHDALRQQVEQFSRISGIRCRLEAEAAAFSAPSGDGIDTAVYRVLQESLSNIVRHAQASEVSVGIRRRENRLSLTVRDNGVGLPTPAAPRGSGLRGIAERVADAGGHLDIDSVPGMGTALTMSFPLQ
jgi:signal transduction histidine kinase